MPTPPDNHGLGSPTHQLSNTKTPSCEPGEAPWRNTSRRDTTQGPSHHTVAALPFALSSPITTTPTPPSLPAVTGADPPVATLRRALWAIDRVWRGWQAGHDAPTPPRRAVCHDNKSAPCSKKKKTPLRDEPVEPDPHHPGPPMTQYDLAPRRTVYGAHRPRPRPRGRQGSSFSRVSTCAGGPSWASRLWAGAERVLGMVSALMGDSSPSSI